MRKVKNRLFKKKQKKLKHFLSLDQNNESINIRGTLSNDNYIVKELRFISRDNERIIKIKANQASSTFDFKVNPYEFPEFQNGEEQLYNLFLYVNVPKRIFSEIKAEKLESNAEEVIKKDGEVYFGYPIRLGRFEDTVSENLNFIEHDGSVCSLYITVKGNVSFVVNRELKQSSKTKIDYLRLEPHRLMVGGKLYTRNSKINDIKLILFGRKLNVSTTLPLKLKFLEEATRRKYGLNRYDYQADIDLNKLFENEALDEDIYDLHFEVQFHDCKEPTRIRVGKPRIKARNYSNSSSAIRGNKVFGVSPYYTSKGFNLSLQVDKFESDTYEYLRKLMRWYWLIRPFYRKKNIWIVGEQPFKAQDTGLAFYKYVRKNHPNKNVYYVIEKDSPEFRNVEPYGNILDFKSKEHIWHVLMARKIVGSHHPDYLYPLRTNEFKKKVKAIKVFLQHGVMGTKNSVHFYGKNSPGFDVDMVFVSSDYEKDILVNDFQYRPEEVKVTGLSRFDTLLNGDVQVKRQLLIIPTWREWLVSEEQFLESEYFERYTTLVNDPRLHELSQKYNFEITFCLHPNMQKFTSLFKNAPVRVISQGEVDVQYLLKESAMMITDYSSVAFDFSFLTKPIIYYQFDRSRFIGKLGSHLDLDNDLPGDIVYDQESILQLVEEYAQSDFEMKKENEIRASKFLKFKDLRSSERIYNEVTKVRKKGIIKSALESKKYRDFYNRFRKSRYYFPSMKLFYAIAKRILPVDKNLILFESGVGKQYSDSPRYIYEEILKRRLKYKVIWVCNKQIRFNDPNTKRIKRLSPQYYYYLARARVWVNNQNFPTYIIKRPQTTYIQTWHGTPLKKMLFDIEEVQGRNEGYLERVYNATKTWDYLISPSPYATGAFKSAFRYEGNILETGYPRNDIFYKKENEKGKIAHLVRNRLNLPHDKKVILYAPTFRDNQTSKNNKFLFDINMDLHKMKETIGDDYILLLRMHVAISNKLKIEKELNDFCYNVSSYSDMQELLLITDILITDYSSVMFDFANTKNPILYYTYDLEIYRDQVRGFYLDFEKEAPGPFMRTTEDIIENIIGVKEVEKHYLEKYNDFYNKYCLLEDGHASERIVDKLFV
ncbi:CDP-glycerol glycerophosphotransferase family protein [Pullulanibacillus pueri]|nr:CDP-glycerol glycerophosphotransferase family protein [Pullulanibacillus pueri]